MKYIAEWIKACEYLRDYYGGKGEEVMQSCPLCGIGAKVDSDDCCNGCLWVVFEGVNCSEYLREILKYQNEGGWSLVAQVRREKPLFWVRDRVVVLTVWIKRLKEIQRKQRLKRLKGEDRYKYLKEEKR